MHVGRIAGATRVIGKQQGYFGLPVRDEVRATLEQRSTLELIKDARELARLLVKVPATLGPGIADGPQTVAHMLRMMADRLETLPIRDERQSVFVDGPNTPVMVTAWFPTPDELKALELGSAIHVELLGMGHPPITVKIGPLPE